MIVGIINYDKNGFHDLLPIASKLIDPYKMRSELPIDKTERFKSVFK